MSLGSIPHVHYLWLVLASLIAGIMNAMAGGGSFVAFPAMLAMGVPPVQANATNTVALWPGQLTSVAALRKDLRRDMLPVVVLVGVLGGVIGAEVLLHTTQGAFLRLVPWLILAGTLMFGISGPVTRQLRTRNAHPALPERMPSAPVTGMALLPVCVYVGYFGAGAGFLVMTVLAFLGLSDAHQLNALKVLVATVANFCAIVTFILRGAVVWHYCVISMVFAAAGGYIGAHFARRISGDKLRTVVVVVGLVIAGAFFWKQAHPSAGGGPLRQQTPAGGQIR